MKMYISYHVSGIVILRKIIYKCIIAGIFCLSFICEFIHTWLWKFIS